jgi:hypothetical protein
MGGLLGSCAAVVPLGHFVVAVLVGTLHCVGRLLLRRGGPFLCLLTCPWRSGLILVGILQMGCKAWGLSSLVAVCVGSCSARIPPVSVGRSVAVAQATCFF